MSALKQKTILITGSTRGIGEAMALRFAKDGAHLIITGKTDKPHAKLPGTIYSVAEAVEKLGGKALPLVLDVRSEQNIEKVVEQAAAHFGGIDILVNNASAINITNTLHTKLKRFDLMMNVNARATFACSRACIPYLKKSKNPHILNIAPPLNMQVKWFKDCLAYTYSKYGMSICTLGMSAEFEGDRIAINSLWPKTTIATSAVKVHFPDEIYQASRKPSIMADAAYEVITQDSCRITGEFLVDEEVLRSKGVSNFDDYSLNPGINPYPDFFLD